MVEMTNFSLTSPIIYLNPAPFLQSTAVYPINSWWTEALLCFTWMYITMKKNQCHEVQNSNTGKNKQKKTQIPSHIYLPTYLSISLSISDHFLLLKEPNFNCSKTRWLLSSRPNMNMMNMTYGFAWLNNVQLLSLRVYSVLLPAFLTIMAVCWVFFRGQQTFTLSLL